MILTVGSLPSDSTDLVLCYYTNGTTAIQQARISGSAQGGFERVIFPKQRILFEAHPQALLEIQSYSRHGKTVLQQIPCLQLKVNQKDHFSVPELSTTLDSVP